VCQLQDVVCRGSSANYHSEVCPDHPWLTGRCRDTKTVVACVIEKGHLSVEILSLILY
jgi:hypothetical protein